MMKPNKTDLTLSIGEVSDLLGISPSMLRNWESEGLYVPGRTGGGHRIFRSHDVRRLRRIAKLYFDEKLNTAAIRRELGPVDGIAQNLNVVDMNLGEKLRSLRLKRGMTLVATAEKSGLSTSFISSLERGNSGASIEALFRLAEAIGTTLPTLRSSEGESYAQSYFVSRDKRTRFLSDDGSLLIEDIIPKPARIEAQISSIAPGTDSGGVFSHKGQEFLHVLEGQLSFWLEPGEFYAMRPGDTLYLLSHLEHSWKNEGTTMTKVLWVNAALPLEKEEASEMRPKGATKTSVN